MWYIGAGDENMIEAEHKKMKRLAKGFFDEVLIKISALGARWGYDSEDAFREAVKYVIQTQG